MKNNQTAEVLPNVILNKSKLRARQGRWAWAFLSPTLVLFTVFTLIPLIMAFVLSFTNFDLYYDFSPAGFKNYIRIFDGGVISKDFWRSVINVLIFALMSVPMNVIGAMLISNLVNAKLKGMKVYRFIYYLPAVTSGIATAFCWKWLLNYNNGLINSLIVSMGGVRVEWLTSYNYLPMFAIAIISTWGSLGGNMLIYLAALKGINPDLYEAASLDGANAVTKFFCITLPSVRPTTFFIVTMSIIGSFQLFDTVWFVTGQSVFTQTPVLQIYNEAFRQSNAGLGSAMSIILLLIILVVTFVVQKTMKEE